MKTMLLAGFILISFTLVAQAATSDVVLIVSKKTDGTRTLSNVDGAYETLQLKGVSKDSFKKALQQISEKLGKTVDNAVALGAKAGNKYELSEVEIGLSVSTEAGIGPVFSVGGSSGIVLHFTK